MLLAERGSGSLEVFFLTDEIACRALYGCAFNIPWRSEQGGEKKKQEKYWKQEDKN